MYQISVGFLIKPTRKGALFCHFPEGFGTHAVHPHKPHKLQKNWKQYRVLHLSLKICNPRYLSNTHQI